jgi:hypothetical protein
MIKLPFKLTQQLTNRIPFPVAIHYLIGLFSFLALQAGTAEVSTFPSIMLNNPPHVPD